MNRPNITAAISAHQSGFSATALAMLDVYRSFTRHSAVVPLTGILPIKPSPAAITNKPVITVRNSVAQ